MAIPPLLVYVIESPSSIDLLDGRTEGRVLTETLRSSGIAASYNLVVDLEALDEALGPRLDAIMRENPAHLPVVHWSGHGSPDDVALTDRTRLTWHEFGDRMRALNTRLEGSLLVCMSTCYGYNIRRSILTRVDAELPFFVVVGHPDKLDWSDGAIAYAVFYHRLSKEFDFVKAVDAMRVASGDSRFVVDLGARIQGEWIAFLKDEGPNGMRQTLLNLLSEDDGDRERGDREQGPDGPS